MSDDLVIEQAAQSTEGADPIAPDTNSVTTDTTAAQSTQQAITDLDKLDRVRFGGKEHSIKELRASFMRQQDYSKKTKELAENRKYAENFASDLIQVVRNPRLLDEFKKIYPAQYHALVESYLKEHQGGQSAVQPGEASQSEALPPEIQKLLDSKLRPYEEKLGKIDAWEANVKEQETRAVGEQIETLHDRLGKKYEFADPDLVDHRILVAKEKGVEVTTKNLAKVYEAVYKDLHEKNKSRLDTQYKTKVNEQVNTGRAAKDVGGNGGDPANPPVKFKSSNEMFKALNAQLAGK